MMRIFAVSLMVAGSMSLCGATAAFATFPGKNGGLLAVKSNGSTVEINLANGVETLLDRQKLSGLGITARSYSPDGSQILVIDGGQAISTLSVTPRTPLKWRKRELRVGKITDAAFSPDGRSIAYTDNGAIDVIPLEGGEPRRVYSPGPHGFARSVEWTSSGRIVGSFFNADTSVNRVGTIPSTGGPLQLIHTTTITADDRGETMPSVAPGADRVAYAGSYGAFTPMHIFTSSLPIGAPSLLMSTPISPIDYLAWTPNGKEIIYAQKYDGRYYLSAVKRTAKPTINDDPSNYRTISERREAYFAFGDIRPISSKSNPNSAVAKPALSKIQPVGGALKIDTVAKKGIVSLTFPAPAMGVTVTGQLRVTAKQAKALKLKVPKGAKFVVVGTAKKSTSSGKGTQTITITLNPKAKYALKKTKAKSVTLLAVLTFRKNGKTPATLTKPLTAKR